MFEKFKNRKVSTPGTIILRIIGGGYLVITAYQLYQGRLESTIPFAALIAACIIFAVVGGGLAGLSVVELFTGRYQGGMRDNDSENEE